MAVRRVCVGHHPDLRYQPAQRFRRLHLEARILQGGREVANFGPVEVRQARVQPQGGWFRALGQKARQGHLLAFQLRHPVLHARLIHPVLDSREDAVDLLVDLGKVAAGFLPRGIRTGGFGIEGAAVFLDEGGDQIGVQEVVAQAGEHAILDHFALDRGAVGADGLALVARGHAAVTGLVDQGIARPAAAAFENGNAKVSHGSGVIISLRAA